MSTSTTIELTGIEEECGVTAEKVRAMRKKIAFIDDSRAVVFPRFTGAALASATARYAFDEPAVFAGLNSYGQPVYRRESQIGRLA